MDDIEKLIISALRESKNPLSTQDIANRVNHHWSTIQIRCLRLQNKNKINGYRVGRTNIWIYKPEADEEAKLEVIRA